MGIWLLWIILLWKFLSRHVFISLEYISRNRIAGSDTTLCSIVWDADRLFFKCCTILHSHSEHMKLLIFPHSCQHFPLSDFLIITPLNHVKWDIFVAWFPWGQKMLSLMCLLAICIHFLEKWLFRSFAHLLMGFLLITQL